MKYSYLSWLQTVGAQMKFPPDRDAVLAELADHMADRREDFIKQGMTSSEAGEAVAAIMGDPVEVGKTMNRVHRPVLGWLWQISRILVVAALVLGLCQWIWNDRFSARTIVPDLSYDWELDGCAYGLEQEGAEAETLASVSSGHVERAGVYTLTLDHGNWTMTEDRQQLLLGFRLKAESLFDLNPLGFSRWLCAEDDLGNTYQRQYIGANTLQVSRNALNLYECEWRAPYLHLMWTVEDTTPREWIRFYIPNTDFDITVNAKGMVIG